MAERVKARRLSDEEGQRLLQIVRRGEPKMTKSVIRYRRAMVVLASASGNSVPAIARLVAADEDTVREVIHRFNELGMGALDPRWAGGRPRRISAEDEAFLIETATTPPRPPGPPLPPRRGSPRLSPCAPATSGPFPCPKPRGGSAARAGGGPAGCWPPTRSP